MIQLQGTDQTEEQHMGWQILLTEKRNENTLILISLYHALPCKLFLYHMNCLHGSVLQFFQPYL